MSTIKITVDRIQPGLHIRLPLKWNEHPFLFNSFKIKDQEQVDMIRHLGVKYVYLNVSQSDTQPLPANQTASHDESQSDKLDVETQKLWSEKQKRIEKLWAYGKVAYKAGKKVPAVTGTLLD